MKAVSLLLRILAIAGAIVAAIGWFAINGKLKEANDTIARTQAGLNAAKQEASDAEQRFQAADARGKSLDAELADQRSRATSARTQLAEANRNITTLREEIRQGQSQIQSLEGQNTNLKEELISMRTAVPTVDTESVAEYEERIKTLTQQVATLRDEVATATARGAAAPTGTAAIGTTPSGAPRSLRLASTGDTASVLKADIPNGMIIISRGQKQGLQEQMEFGIAKGFSAPMRVKLTRVEPEYSLAYILPGDTARLNLTEGDEVTLIQ